MPSATVDIMLPYYGDPELLRVTVRSVLAQDDHDWRLTVVDDGYPDSSIPGWFDALNDERINYFRNKENLGANRNYQRCLELVEHEFVVMMGADDKMLPNYVRTVRGALMKFPGAQFVQPGVRVIDEHGVSSPTVVDVIKRRVYAPRGSGRQVLAGEQLARSLLRGNWLYFPSICWRADPLRRAGFREGLNVVQDLCLALELVEEGAGLVVDDTLCFEYRRHRASDSSLRALAGDRFIEEREYFLDTAQRMREIGWQRAARSAQLHVSSRLHALTLLPKAARHGHRQGLRNLGRHVFGVARHAS